MSQVSISGSRWATSPSSAMGHQVRGVSVASRITAYSAGTAAGSTFTATGGGGGGGGGSGSGSNAVPIGKIPAGLSQDLTGIEHLALGHPHHSPGGLSEAGRSDAAYSEAASQYDPAPTAAAAAGAARSRAAAAAGSDARRGLDTLRTASSAAGSRFDGSPTSNASFMSRVAGSPTEGGGGGGARAGGAGAAPYTTRSAVSSIRSDAGSSFFRGSGSARSMESRAKMSDASGSSFDEEDLQNMGTRWLSERAYAQKYDGE